jgi:hypothetical protein
MLSKDGRKVICDVGGCGKEAIGGCELRIEAGIGGERSTIPGDLIAWCDFHQVSLRVGIEGEFILLDLEQLKAGYITHGAKRGRST